VLGSRLSEVRASPCKDILRVAEYSSSFDNESARTGKSSFRDDVPCSEEGESPGSDVGRVELSLWTLRMS